MERVGEYPVLSIKSDGLACLMQKEMQLTEHFYERYSFPSIRKCAWR